jgi:ribosomal protein S18 acetylase RimI-like enzyme
MIATESDVIRPLLQADRQAVQDIIVRTGHFTPIETATALELIDDWLNRGQASGYLCYVATSGTAVLGYCCVGPTPLTEGTYDLYWIAVDPDLQGRGIGRKLLVFAEVEVRGRGGRLLLIETSSQELYGSTVHFYERAGYDLVARIPEFYKPGDDKLIFAKRL